MDLSKEASDHGLDTGISCKESEHGSMGSSAITDDPKSSGVAEAPGTCKYKDCEFIVSGKLKRSKIKQRMQAHRNKHHPVGSSISNDSTSQTLTPDPMKHHKINADTEIPDNTDVIASEETAVIIIIASEIEISRPNADLGNTDNTDVIASEEIIDNTDVIASEKNRHSCGLKQNEQC